VTYRTFIRSCTNFRSFAKARKTTVSRGLSYEQAQTECRNYNSQRNAQQKRKGTMMEFEHE
jgi:hypothetical protein